MYMSFYELINEYWIYLVLAIITLIFLGVLFYLIYNTYFNERKSFKENLSDSKSIEFTIVIDYEEKLVEKYYMYEQNGNNEIMLLDEFFVKFDKANVEKFKNWLETISKNLDFDKTRRIEIVMYDKHSERSIYLVELENYHIESKKFFLNFKDISNTPQIQRRASKKVIKVDDAEFYEKANDRIFVSDFNSKNFIVAIKYKEYQCAEKELQIDLLNEIEENLYDALNELKNDNDLLCLSSNGTFLLFSANVVNVKKYKQHIKRMLSTISGERVIVENKFSYTTTLIAGFTYVLKEEKLTMDKILEAESAANFLLGKSRHSSERLQQFDEHLRNAMNIANNKLMIIEKVVNDALFSLEYTPIINVKNKKVNEYYVNIKLPHAINMELSEFLQIAKKRTFRTAFYQKIFSKMIEDKKNSNDKYYLSFDYDDLTKVMEAYASNKLYSKLDIYFCMSFSGTTLQNTNLISIEKKLDVCKKDYDVKFGILYNGLNTIYLNAKIYKKADVVLLSGSLIEHSLDTYENSSLIDVYIKVASSYSHEVIGLNVQNLALYEMLMHFKVKKVAGTYLTPYVTKNNQIEDKTLLKVLSDIENKKY